MEVILKEGFPGTGFSLTLPSAMPQYTLFISNKQRRIKYPKSFDLPDADTARRAALKLVRVFSEFAPYWDELSYEQQGDFVIEIADEEGQTILTVPFREDNDAKG